MSIKICRFYTICGHVIAAEKIEEGDMIQYVDIETLCPYCETKKVIEGMMFQ